MADANPPQPMDATGEDLLYSRVVDLCGPCLGGSFVPGIYGTRNKSFPGPEEIGHIATASQVNDDARVEQGCYWEL